MINRTYHMGYHMGIVSENNLEIKWTFWNALFEHFSRIKKTVLALKTDFDAGLEHFMLIDIHWTYTVYYILH